MLSTLYIFITCLLASDRFYSYREDKPEFCTMGSIDVSETFFVLYCFQAVQGHEKEVSKIATISLKLVR